jgi:hypothetical protein
MEKSGIKERFLFNGGFSSIESLKRTSTIVRNSAQNEVGLIHKLIGVAS